MQISNRTAMVIFNFITAALAGLATWIQFLSFGHDAWRLFATWVTLAAAIYYCLDALVGLLHKRRTAGTELCPMLQGALIVSGITLLLIRIICYAMDSYIPSAGVNVVLSDFILPVLMIMSWVMFSQKGKWRAYEPFYWLAFPAIYASMILVSGEFMSHTARLVYPYEFLDYPAIGIDTMLWWFAILTVLILIVGYVFWISDFALSGKLAERIVMPKIKTVIIEEEVEDEADEPELAAKPEEKPVKLVTTGSRNLPVLKAQAKKNTEIKSGPAQAKKSSSEGPKESIKSAGNSPKAKPGNKPATKPNGADKTGVSKQPATAKQADAKQAAVPPVRIIEKIDLTPSKKLPAKTSTPEHKAQAPTKTDKAPKLAETKEVVIEDGKKSVAPKPEETKPKATEAKPKTSETKSKVNTEQPQKPSN